MGRVFVVELDGKLYRCRVCGTHLALADDLISKGFHCPHGKAFLFSNVSNVSFGDYVERMMLSGMHTVVDIFCCSCGQNVGWKYESTREKTQKHKEGKFVLERGKIDDGPDSHYYIDTAPPADHNENMFMDDDN